MKVAPTALLVAALVLVSVAFSASRSQPAVSPTPATALVTTLTPDALVVRKAERQLIFMRLGQELRRYPILSYGAAPKGHKWQRGDERTPEGQYIISGKHRSANFQWFLRISYPNEKDVRAARLLGVDPGGDIGIHGFPDGWELALKYHGEWTDGCIGISNSIIRDVYDAVAIGTPITILP